MSEPKIKQEMKRHTVIMFLVAARFDLEITTFLKVIVMFLSKERFSRVVCQLFLTANDIASDLILLGHQSS